MYEVEYPAAVGESAMSEAGTPMHMPAPEEFESPDELSVPVLSTGSMPLK